LAAVTGHYVARKTGDAGERIIVLTGSTRSHAWVLALEVLVENEALNAVETSQFSAGIATPRTGGS